MKRKITSLFVLLTLVGFNLSATNALIPDGLYTIQCKGTSKYMVPNGTSDVKMDTEAAIFYVSRNTSDLDTVMYNIFSEDKTLLAYSDVAKNKGSMMANTDADMNSTTSGALLALTVFSDGVYNIVSQTSVGEKYWNGQRTNKTDVGMGSARTGVNYDWIFTPYVALPTVSITQPADNYNVGPGETLVLKATAAAEEGETLASVVFFVDDVEVGTGVLNEDVYEYTWTAPNAVATYAVTAKATSSASAVKVSDTVNVVVALLPVSVTLSNPVDGSVAEVNSSFTLRADASPASGSSIAKVEFFEGTSLLGEGSLVGDVYELEWTPAATGSYAITAKVTDADNTTATSSAVALEVVDALVKSIHLGFEDGLIADWTASAGTLINSDAKPRTGSKSLQLDAAEKVDLTNAADAINANEGDKIHIIAWVATPVASDVKSIPAFNVPDNIVKPMPWTPSQQTITESDIYVRQSWNKVALATATDYYAAMRIIDIADANYTLYIDDIVIYTDDNAGIDLVAPEKVTNFVASGTNLSWIKGTDANTYVESTYILSTSNSTAVAPVLKGQAAYSVNDVVGDWTIIAVVDSAATSYTAQNAAAQFAVVHKDLAYNYSEATINAIATGLQETNVHVFECKGLNDAIEISQLPLGEQLSVYSISGAKVYESTITNSQLTVDLSQGIYLVRVLGDIQKVMVK